jgi:hypothetical protein
MENKNKLLISLLFCIVGFFIYKIVYYLYTLNYDNIYYFITSIGIVICSLFLIIYFLDSSI